MTRSVGVEIELNIIEDNNNFFSTNDQKIENSINYICNLISNLGIKIQSQGWKHNHNNVIWICKPDASCGIEVCSPVFNENFDELKVVLDAFAIDPNIKIDSRCSFHVHIGVNDCVKDNLQISDSLCSILSWWVKSEHIFIDFSNPQRKNNRYCRCIGMTDFFDHEEIVFPNKVFSKLSNKYLTLNTYHLFNKKRSSIEFRLAEGTKDFNFAFSWIKILKLFVEVFKEKEIPENYRWIEPDVFFKLIDFEKNGSIELKKWFLNRLIQNCFSNEEESYWSKKTRKNAFEKYKLMNNK